MTETKTKISVELLLCYSLRGSLAVLINDDQRLVMCKTVEQKMTNLDTVEVIASGQLKEAMTGWANELITSFNILLPVPELCEYTFLLRVAGLDTRKALNNLAIDAGVCENLLGERGTVEQLVPMNTEVKATTVRDSKFPASYKFIEVVDVEEFPSGPSTKPYIKTHNYNVWFDEEYEEYVMILD